MELTQRISDINSINNWEEPHFDWSKAYVASVFAKIAYLHIPQYELKNTNRANLIPCVEYREIVKGASTVNVDQILSGSDFGEFFIVEKPYAVAVVVKVREVLRSGPGNPDGRISGRFASQSRSEDRIQEQQHDQANKTEPLRKFQGESGLSRVTRG
jgi:hypothetical protein